MCEHKNPISHPTMKALEDAQLLDRWRTGDREAGHVLCRRHYAPVFRFFERRAPEEAHDLTQLAFTKCCATRERIRQGDSFRSYVFQVAQNIFVDHLRALQRRRGRTVDADVDTLLSVGVSPSKAAAASEDCQRLASALYSLSINQQCVIELHYFEGLTMEEIALVLAIPPGTVRTRLQSGRRKLAELMTELSGQDAQVDAATIAGWLSELRRYQ